MKNFSILDVVTGMTLILLVLIFLFCITNYKNDSLVDPTVNYSATRAYSIADVMIEKLSEYRSQGYIQDDQYTQMMLNLVKVKNSAKEVVVTGDQELYNALKATLKDVEIELKFISQRITK
jgi:hypothetical protein